MNSRGYLGVVFAVLAFAPVTALAVGGYVLTMGSYSLPVRSMLLWPPDRPVPEGVHFLFDADGPVQEPYELTIWIDDWYCELGSPAAGAQIEYLVGVSHVPGLAFANPTAHLAGPADVAGVAEIVLPLRGGGHGTHLDWDLYGPDVACSFNLDTHLMINSPDINGDLVVDLADLSLFATDLFGVYNYRSDLRWDGEIGLGDITYLTRALFAR